MRKARVLLMTGLLLFGATACGDDDDAGSAAGGGDEAALNVIDVTAKDYSFDVPATIEGGTVQMNYKNAGAEPHFAAFAKAGDGKTFADVKAALTATGGPGAGGGPPPFVEIAGAPVADPGGSGELTFDLPAGTYALFCAIPSPDGVSHAAKGMVVEVTVSEGETVDQPEAVGTITAMDFSLTAAPELEAGENVVALQNNGKQLHEINLIELSAGKTVDDVSAWFKAQNGPPPHKSMAGVAIAPQTTGTATFTLKEGSTYAFICAIPDVLGDFQPHVLKGMATGTFTV